MNRTAILIIDDDMDLRETLVDVLRDEGVDAVAAAGGAEALRLRDDGLVPGLILLDMMMPGMDGRDFRAEQMKDARWAAVPTFLCSAYGDVGATAAALGLAGALEKPVHLDAILALLNRHRATP